MISNVVLIGSGKLATQLGLCLAKTGYNIRQVYSRTIENAQELAERLNAYATDSFNEIQEDADIYIIAVADSVLHTTIESLPKVKGIVVHTAGAMSVDLLIRFDQYGIFYPFQTFSKERDVDFKNIPVLIEACNEDVDLKLKSFASKISKTVKTCDSNQRQQIHLAAVFACNFTNHMYAIAEDILQENDVSFDVIKPIIMETAHKTDYLSPVKAQTGPAVRGDKNVIKKHLEMLDNDDELSVLYSKITSRIAKLQSGKIKIQD
ncbi:Rossmann-like and DUF2520 domain-containing protein [Labilibacter marinus]|uniref:Rossmann-like and DUF2520 domain-containing protein n=1 Tax=Labilibacter marinus TaxID=1477105 RepID=UPI00083341D5|nr:Rossmann-like and DUF2520 domain-containing protein [Labilibacter marinus]